MNKLSYWHWALINKEAVKECLFSIKSVYPKTKEELNSLSLDTYRAGQVHLG